MEQKTIKNCYTIFEFFYDESFKDYSLVEPDQIASYKQTNTTGGVNTAIGLQSLVSKIEWYTTGSNNTGSGYWLFSTANAYAYDIYLLEYKINETRCFKKQ